MDPLKRALAEAETPEWKQKFEEGQRFLREVIYAGLVDLNTGYDAPLVNHFTPVDFLMVIDRCEARSVRIIGIEIFHVVPNEVGFLSCEFPRGYEAARRLVRKYSRRANITVSGTFDVPPHCAASAVAHPRS